MVYVGINGRNTDAYVTDGPNEAWSNGQQTYPVTKNGVIHGRAPGSSASFAFDTNATNDRRLAGQVRSFNFGHRVRVDYNNGDYTARLAIVGSSTSRGYALWDGDIDDPIYGASGGTVAGASLVWASGTAVTAVGKYVMVTVGGVTRMYRSANTTGTMGATKPSHTSGTVTIDGVDWEYIRTALCGVYVANSGSGFIDAKGNTWSAANWPANNVVSDVFRVTKNYIVGVMTSESSINTLLWSHISLQTAVTPLEDVTLQNEMGEAITTPNFFTNQPPGFPFAKIITSNGDQTFTVDPTCAYAGYLTAQQITNCTNPGYYLVSTNTPIPDSLAGTPQLRIIQSTVGTADRTTSFSTVLTSSGGRVAESGIRGLISTQSWMISNQVRTAMASRWMGYQGQPILPANDKTATNTSTLQSAYAAISPPVNNTEWYRIRLQGTDYTGSLSFASKNFGSGGLLIEPDTGFDPTLNFSCGTVIRGLHLRGLRIINNFLKTNNFTGGFIFNDPGNGAAFYNRVKVENCRIGTIFEQPNSGAGDTLNYGGDEQKIMAMTRNGDTKPMYFYHAEQVEFVNNIFDGAGICIYVAGARLLVIENNLCRRATNDFIAWTPTNDYNNTNQVTAFGDNNMYVSMRNNTFHAELDYDTYSNGQHGDFRQIRNLATLRWAANSWAGGDESKGTQIPFSVGTRRIRDGNIYRVSAITTGKTGSVGPSGTGIGQVDGGVTWDYDRTLQVINIIEEFSGNVCISATLKTSGGTSERQFYFCNSDETKHTISASVFDNVEASATVYGVTNGHIGTVWAEYNTMLGSADIHPSVPQSKPHLLSFTSSSRLFGRNNVFSSTDSASVGRIQAFNQQIADCTDFEGPNTPMNILQGTWASDGVVINVATGHTRAKWDRSALDGFIDGPTKTKAEVDLAIRKQYRAKPGIGAGCSCTIPVTIGPASGFSGDPISTTVTLTP